ncbi:MAG: hypothetical protein C4560_09175 [Nitrospiraceae bacterium]|nr:MAG: hypothetical protein C4560_09175 [Nitrospiraceae bacterium]
MAHILIDGYNLIGIAHGNLEMARNDLIQKLYKYADTRGHDITLVFDGWKNGQPVESRTKAGCVTVIYSRLGEKADQVIRNKLSETATQWIVVSSDREIYDFAERKDFAAITSDEFERKLYSALDECNPDNPEESSSAEDEDVDCAPARRKGASGKLSKKDKRKIQALNKL